jgi:hypothetical protein
MKVIKLPNAFNPREEHYVNPAHVLTISKKDANNCIVKIVTADLHINMSFEDTVEKLGIKIVE